ncbi:exo-alpha-sialidase [bacterium]|nr:exo-alpha-sialidase [bacterium]
MRWDSRLVIALVCAWFALRGDRELHSFTQELGPRKVACVGDRGTLDLAGAGLLRKDGIPAMANHVFSLRCTPKVEFVRRQEFGGENGTSFEDEKAGEFNELETEVGTWRAVKGKVVVDNQHAKSGKHCLQIAGGEESSVELSIGGDVRTNGRLSFWAERWTSRTPFRFRIEKRSGGIWSEVYNGDKSIRVGRSFFSHVQVPLGDEDITNLRFSVTSPANTGILIDDLKIAPAEPMKVASVEAVPLALPALVGAERCSIAKVKVTTTGMLNPISINEITASLIGESSEVNIKDFQPFFGGNDPSAHWNEPFAMARTPRQGNVHRFSDTQPLAEGDNFIWLACKLKNEANIDQHVAARFNSISFSNGVTIEIDGKPSVQRLGVALRKAGDEDVHTYRIPGLATTNEGTLIGVYDVRWSGGRDLPGNIDVGMSRSTDGGRTWEAMKVIMDMGSDPKWHGDGIGDPSLMVDRKTGTIWVSATWSHGNRSWVGSGPGLKPEDTGQWMLVKSEDDGVTWSDPINITTQVKKPEWSFILQGPGKGITMSDGTLVFPAQFQDPPNKNDKKANRLPHSTFIYSRDNGATWATAMGAWDDTTEAQVIELSDGELMLNCRNNRGPKRAIMTTSDLGQTWEKHATHVKALVEPGSCMASLVNVGRELGWREIRSEFNHEFLLFSNPDSLQGRNHMTIKASKDSGATWPTEFQLLLDEEGGAGYSCMSMIDAETVGILYEGSQAHMTFQRVKIADILNPPKGQKNKNPAFSASPGMGSQPFSIPQGFDEIP